MQGPKWPIILLPCGPCVVIVYGWDRLCTLGRAPRTKETMPDFHEWCRVTRYPRIFRGLTSCQRTPRFWGVTASTSLTYKFNNLILGFYEPKIQYKHPNNPHVFTKFVSLHQHVHCHNKQSLIFHIQLTQPL